jgi:hypothetical protein
MQATQQGRPGSPAGPVDEQDAVQPTAGAAGGGSAGAWPTAPALDYPVTGAASTTENAPAVQPAGSIPSGSPGRSADIEATSDHPSFVRG